MTTTTATSGFCGWHRPDKRSPWQLVCQAASEDAALGKLLDAVRGKDKTVLPAGQNPNERRAAR
jgi:hypothetical protein